MGMGDLGGMMKQVQEMQERLQKVQDELETKTVTGESGGGMVRAVVNGRHQVVGIEIEKEVINPDDAEMLGDLIVSAINQALENSSRMAQEEMSKVTQGILPNIPGLKLPGL